MSDSELERCGEEEKAWFKRIDEEIMKHGEDSDEAHALRESLVRHTLDDFIHQDTYDEN